MQDYLITFAARNMGTNSYIITGEASKADAVATASYMMRIEGGAAWKLKEARAYKGVGDHYVCKGW